MLLPTGCQTSPPALWPGEQRHEPGSADYATALLLEGDVISITFQYSTNYNAVQKIKLDGMLNLEAVAPVKAAGKTLEQLQAELLKLYLPLVKEDVVTAKLVGASASIYLSGAVIRPGRIPLDRPMTALEAIMEGGGFDPSRANLSQVAVLRLEGGRQQRYQLNLKRVLEGGDSTPFYLKPFDIVHVPLKRFNF